MEPEKLPTRKHCSKCDSYRPFKFFNHGVGWCTDCANRYTKSFVKNHSQHAVEVLGGVCSFPSCKAKTRKDDKPLIISWRNGVDMESKIFKPDGSMKFLKFVQTYQRNTWIRQYPNIAPDYLFLTCTAHRVSTLYKTQYPSWAQLEDGLPTTPPHLSHPPTTKLTTENPDILDT